MAATTGLCNHLRHGMLDLKMKRLHQGELEALCALIESDRELRHIDLWGTHLKDRELVCLTKAICKSSTLLSVDFGANEDLTDSSITQFFLALADRRNHPGSLATVGFAQCGGVNDATAAAIAAAILSGCTPLCSLDFHNCNISNEGAFTLSEVLADPRSLRNLYLYHNKISSKGARQLLNAFMRNKTLEYIDMHMNAVGTSILDEVDAIRAERSATVRQLSTARNLQISGVLATSTADPVDYRPLSSRVADRRLSAADCTASTVRTAQSFDGSMGSDCGHSVRWTASPVLRQPDTSVAVQVTQGTGQQRSGPSAPHPKPSNQSHSGGANPPRKDDLKSSYTDTQVLTTEPSREVRINTLTATRPRVEGELALQHRTNFKMLRSSSEDALRKEQTALGASKDALTQQKLLLDIGDLRTNRTTLSARSDTPSNSHDESIMLPASLRVQPERPMAAQTTQAFRETSSHSTGTPVATSSGYSTDEHSPPMSAREAELCAREQAVLEKDALLSQILARLTAKAGSAESVGLSAVAIEALARQSDGPCTPAGGAVSALPPRGPHTMAGRSDTQGSGERDSSLRTNDSVESAQGCAFSVAPRVLDAPKSMSASILTHSSLCDGYNSMTLLERPGATVYDNECLSKVTPLLCGRQDCRPRGPSALDTRITALTNDELAEFRSVLAMITGEEALCETMIREDIRPRDALVVIKRALAQREAAYAKKSEQLLAKEKELQTAVSDLKTLSETYKSTVLSIQSLSHKKLQTVRAVYHDLLSIGLEFTATPPADGSPIADIDAFVNSFVGEIGSFMKDVLVAMSRSGEGQ